MFNQQQGPHVERMDGLIVPYKNLGSTRNEIVYREISPKINPSSLNLRATMSSNHLSVLQSCLLHCFAFGAGLNSLLHLFDLWMKFVDWQVWWILEGSCFGWVSEILWKTLFCPFFFWRSGTIVQYAIAGLLQLHSSSLSKMHITPSYYFLIIASVWRKCINSIQLCSLLSPKSILLLQLTAAFLADTVPGCPLDSPEMLLADVDNRCDRYWHCHNGVVTSFYCPFGSGFDPFTDTCHNFAACLKNPTTASDPATIDSVRPSISVETLVNC